MLDLIPKHNPAPDFGFVVYRLFGDSPTRGKSAKVGDGELVYSGFAKNGVSFLPANWRKELDRIGVTWRGCENWWLGYPFISLMELKVADDGTKGNLKLNAEVGPISNHKVRKGIISAITAAAREKNFDRLLFPVGASDKGRLYSRFLRKNSIAVNDIYDTDEMGTKFMQLIADFGPEFELVASVIPEFFRLGEL
ncbi:hypothetical protein [Rhizobium tropici]|uniref:Uncharacterized protein n=1 Tax=Rhizobium tropici TaxID=398 RepID=A0A329YA38_RHITR|nr:hypothetical protein [Rhizobium tropici]RAX37855.1 hypothetical protein DQ393_29650 [Rhizobium tropici]